MSKPKVVIGGLLIFIIGCIFAFNWFQDSRMPNFKQLGEIYVYPDDDVETVISKIEDEAGVRNMASLKRAFRSKEVAKYLQVGHYTISKGNSSVYVARMLNNGWQTPVKLTLSGNLRRKDNISAKIASQMMVDSATVYKALNDEALLGKYGFTSRTAFSLLMPDSYEMYWTASIEEILDKQKAAWDAFWTEENDAKAKALGMSRQDVSTLASIVKGESNYAPEMPKIAGVYLNRLKIGMPLQADPTIAFCYNYTLNRVLFSHLKVDSPYNTYKHQGLPPGPICVPTKTALEAVLNPDFGGTWGNGNLYFCANPDFTRTHVFARTMSEHEANAAAFRAELNRRARAKAQLQ